MLFLCFSMVFLCFPMVFYRFLCFSYVVLLFCSACFCFLFFVPWLLAQWSSTPSNWWLVAAVLLASPHAFQVPPSLLRTLLRAFSCAGELPGGLRSLGTLAFLRRQHMAGSLGKDLVSLSWASATPADGYACGLHEHLPWRSKESQYVVEETLGGREPQRLGLLTWGRINLKTALPKSPPFARSKNCCFQWFL